MSVERISVCPVCEGTDFLPVLKTRDFTTTQEEFQIEKCSTCNFLLTNPRPDLNSIGRYYESENYISHSGKSSLFGNLYRFARKYTINSKYNLIKNLKGSEGKLLDYGCGSGEFIAYIKSKKWEVIGIEPNNIARNKAFELTQQTVYQSITEIKDTKFDVITLWHVLEHVHDINFILNQFKNLLKPDGILIIAVPNYKSPDSLKYQTYWAAYDVPRHLWHFSRETMSRLIHKHGLTLNQVQPMKLDAYYVSMLSEGYKNPSYNKLLIGFKAFISGLISNIRAIKTGNYSSLIYICKVQ